MSSRGKRSHRCTVCARRTYRRIRHLPFYDARCERCVMLNLFPRTLEQDR